jgi:hypothetical protein
VRALLIALGAWKLDAAWPPYASHVVFERLRHVATGARFVRVLYNGQIVSLPACGQSLCEEKAFRALLKASIIPDYQRACL